MLEIEARVNLMEVEIDRELSSIIARRQPTARDLRLLIAISKTTANLERAGDEAAKIARMVKSHHRQRRGTHPAGLRAEHCRPTWLPGCCARRWTRFARLDANVALVHPEGGRR